MLWYLYVNKSMVCSMDQLTIKKPNPKCRLYWCFIEFIDWRYSQPCWLVFSTPLLNYSAPLTFSLVHLPSLPSVNKYRDTVCIYTVCTGGGWGRGSGCVESIYRSYSVAWRAGTTTSFLYSVPSPLRLFKNTSTDPWIFHAKTTLTPLMNLQNCRFWIWFRNNKMQPVLNFILSKVVFQEKHRQLFINFISCAITHYFKVKHVLLHLHSS
jgi:hypothetical protein